MASPRCACASPSTAVSATRRRATPRQTLVHVSSWKLSRPVDRAEGIRLGEAIQRPDRGAARVSRGRSWDTSVYQRRATALRARSWAPRRMRYDGDPIDVDEVLKEAPPPKEEPRAGRARGGNRQSGSRRASAFRSRHGQAGPWRRETIDHLPLRGRAYRARRRKRHGVFLAELRRGDSSASSSACTRTAPSGTRTRGSISRSSGWIRGRCGGGRPTICRRWSPTTTTAAQHAASAKAPAGDAGGQRRSARRGPASPRPCTAGYPISSRNRSAGYGRGGSREARYSCSPGIPGSGRARH